MMKAFFKGCWEIFILLLVIAGVLAIICGNIYAGMLTNFYVSIVLFIVDIMVGYGTYCAIDYRKSSNATNCQKYLCEKVTIDEIYERGWISTEDHRMLMSKLITKYKGKGK